MRYLFIKRENKMSCAARKKKEEEKETPLYIAVRNNRLAIDFRLEILRYVLNLNKSKCQTFDLAPQNYRQTSYNSNDIYICHVQFRLRGSFKQNPPYFLEEHDTISKSYAIIDFSF